MSDWKYPQFWTPSLHGLWSPSQGLTWDHLRDYSGRGNRGSLMLMDPGTDWFPSKNGLVLDYDGANDYVSCGPNVLEKGEVTVRARILTRTVGAGLRVIIACCDLSANTLDYLLGLNRTAGKLEITWGNAIIATSTTSLVANKWYDVAATRSGVPGAWTAKIFINGELDVSATTSVNPSVPAGTGTTIGRCGDYNGFFWSGQIGEVCVFSRALKQDELRLLASATDVMFQKKSRRSRRAVGGFRAAWASRRSSMIGAGV